MTEILVSDFVKLILISARVAAILFIAPIFMSNFIPVSIRLLLCFAIAIILRSIVPDISYNFASDLTMLAVMGIKEMVAGLIIGFSFNIVFWGIAFGGSLIGREMGLAMAMVFNPAMEMQTDVMGEVFNYLALLVFIIVNGHHYIIEAIYASFRLIPLGEYSLEGPVVYELIRHTGIVFVIALKMVVPMMVAFFLINIAIGITSRFIPQVQIFFIVQPMHLLMGFIFLSSSMALIMYVIRFMIESVEDNLTTLLRLMGS